MSRAFDPFTTPPPLGGRATLHARLIWTTQVQLWRYTNGGLITGDMPGAETESISLLSPTPEPEPSAIKKATRKGSRR